MMKTQAGRLVLFGCTLLMLACGKYEQFADAEYPDPVIYMPSASTVYDISVANNPYEVPTPGRPYRFQVDGQGNRLVVPLGVLRGGIHRNGVITVDIADRADTVATMIAEGQLDAMQLPASAYALPATASIADGESGASFALTMDLRYLRDRPGQVFAVGVGISSAQRATNPKLATTVVLVKADLFTEIGD